uniref:Uncharacterized protein n=1 Tax=Nelumbo nucifera TaxID=4432 RepID=A0A822YDS9_NELNU|nr:TPA_asm: hypothetical protein HUJ06_009488 [Nelumbo nucifera]
MFRVSDLVGYLLGRISPIHTPPQKKEKKKKKKKL